jgi:glycopeptide antibiotics resistance protein
LYASFVDLKNNSEIKSVVTLISFGTAAWVIAAIVFAITGADAKVIWTCVSGALLGAWGVRYSKRRAKRSGI